MPLQWIQTGLNALGLGYGVYQDQRNWQAAKRQQELENERYIEERDYNRALQQEIFNREDTAIQRAADDAMKAGFSPLTVAGSGASSGAVVGSSYQAPASGQSSPVDVMAMLRGMQELSIAQDANERAERQVESEIAFKEASLDLTREKMGMDFMLSNAKMFNDYQLGLENLRQNDRHFTSEERRLNSQFQRNFILQNRTLANQMRMEQQRFTREGVWREEDIDRYENQFKWQKGEDTIGNIMNFGNLLVDILGVLNGGRR